MDGRNKWRILRRHELNLRAWMHAGTLWTSLMASTTSHRFGLLLMIARAPSSCAAAAIQRHIRQQYPSHQQIVCSSLLQELIFGQVMQVHVLAKR